MSLQPQPRRRWIVQALSAGSVLIILIDPQHRVWIPIAVNAALVPLVGYLHATNPERRRGDGNSAPPRS